MTMIIRLLIAITLATFHPSAFAKVYQCIGADGEKTFAFAPCEEPAPAEPVIVLEEPEATPEVDEEHLLDIRISALQDKLDALRDDYSVALEESRGQSTNDLTANYDIKSSKLLEELMGLYQAKRQVASR